MTDKETTTVTKKKYVRRTAKVLLRVVLYLFLFVILVFLLLLTPPVQRFLTGRVENYLEKKFQTEVKIKRVAFDLSGDVSLRDFLIRDQTGDTLLSGKNIKANISYLKLFSNEVDVKDVELQNVTAKIKRVLPDTTFNFQFIVNAFTSEKQKNPDTATSAPLKLNVSNLTIDSSSVVYKDAITGMDIYARIGFLSTTIDTLNPYTQTFDIPTFIVRNSRLDMTQVKPLVQPKSMSQDLAEAATPSPVDLRIGKIDFTNVSVDYDNDVSAVYSAFNVGRLKTTVKKIDLQHNDIAVDKLELLNTKSDIRLGKKPGAEVVKKQVKQNIEAEAQAGWVFKVDDLIVQNNHIRYNDDTEPKASYGMDYSHLNVSDFDLDINNLLVAPDTLEGSIASASFKEQSGFVLNKLRADVMYANKLSYLKNLYIKTPGSEIKRALVLEYPSIEALTKNFENTVMNIELVNSYVQVKDILTFAPQLRNHPAFANRNDIWNLNLVGSGTMNRLNIENLQFDGLQDTRINASGTLTNLSNPNQAGGNFTIYNLHTNQTDLSLFTGQRLSNDQVNLPETFDASGTIAGNAGRFNTRLNINTSSGTIALNGNFGNVMNPAATTYNGRVTVNGLQLGKILRQRDVIGNFTGSMQFDGRGITPESLNGRFTGNFSNAGIYGYQYSNVKFNGRLNGDRFNFDINVNDPNADLNVTAIGSYGKKTSFSVDGMVDSIKFHKINLSDQPLTFRGKIDATVDDLNPDYLDGNVFVTDGLLVTKDSRLPLDTVHLLAAHTDTGQLIRLRSPIADAQISGQYKISELANILANNMDPYFSVNPQKAKQVGNYNINFNADVAYSDVLAGFVPDLKKLENLHIQGNLSSSSGLTAVATSPSIVYQDYNIENARFNVYTDAAGLHIKGNVGHFVSGNSLEAYNARINATALRNNIDFSVAMDGKSKANKYVLAGELTQPSEGTYRIHLNPDSLILNFEKWQVSPDNSITITGNNIEASNFSLSQGGQSLTVNSIEGEGNPLQVTFSNFRIATITGFMKADTTLIDGVTNGTVTLRNIMTQPVFTSDLNISDLSFRQDTIGNVNVQVRSSGKDYITNAVISGRGNDIRLTGSFTPREKDVALNLDLDIREMNMETMEGLLEGFITDASGDITGNVRIRGTTTNPDINGRLDFNETSITTVALGGPFRINNQTLNITNDGFVFNDFTVQDSANYELVLDGTALTDNFINYKFNLSLSADHFRVLNTAKQKNSIYYGDLYISTQLNIRGTETTPAVDGSITVEDGTDFTFVVPQTDPAVVSRQGIVEFVDFSNPSTDSLFLQQYDSLNVTNLIGYDISTNIQINKEAVFNIVIDEANGDLMNLQGEALLSAGIDPGGKITLTGSYELTEGYYEINYNFLRRKFVIQEGSKIVWLGEPTNASLDVTAIYTIEAAPLDLVANYISAPTDAIRNTYLQKLPFQVILELTGDLMQPNIGFDIDLPEKAYPVGPNVTRNVDLRLQQLRQQPGELNKQVFSLLVLNRFVGENPFESSGAGFSAGNYARQSVTKLLTEQLNKLADDLIAGVDVNFDVVSTDDYSTGALRNRTDLNVGLSKTLLNDRLTVSVGSNFELNGNQANAQRNSNFAGNVAITYLLSRDGKYRLRLYRKNEFFGAVEGYIIETGVNFMILLDYDKFIDLLRKNQKVQDGSRRPAKQNEGNE